MKLLDWELDKEFSKEEIDIIINNTLDEFREEVIESFTDSFQKENRGWNSSKCYREAKKFVEQNYDTLEKRMKIVPGKKVLSKLSDKFHEKYGVILNPVKIAYHFEYEDISEEMFDFFKTFNVDLRDF